MSNLLTSALLVLSLLAGSCVLAQTDTGPMQLATTYEGNIDVSNYLVSEKLDGIRARWTGTELVTRNGNPIVSPAWFTEGWPVEPLDGELWTARGDFERIASIVLSETPDTRWQHVSMMVFDMPLANIPFEQRLTLFSSTNRCSNSAAFVTLSAADCQDRNTAYCAKALAASCCLRIW